MRIDRGNLSIQYCHFILHKSHMTWPGANPGRRSGKSPNNLLYKINFWRFQNRTAYLSADVQFPFLRSF
jgi:hypothetical protein